MGKYEKREDRRDRTWRYAAKTRREHLRVVHPDGKVDCTCELSAWFFRKGKSVGCRCHRHPPGRPKIAWGCGGGGTQWQDTVVERIAGRRLCRAWREQVRSVEPDDLEL